MFTSRGSTKRIGVGQIVASPFSEKSTLNFTFSLETPNVEVTTPFVANDSVVKSML